MVTRILFDPRRDLPTGSTQSNPVTIEATPTGIREDGQIVVYPTTITFTITTGADILQLPANTASNGWRLTARDKVTSTILQTRVVRVPDQASIAYQTLPDIDPSSFEVTPGTARQWDATFWALVQAGAGGGLTDSGIAALIGVPTSAVAVALAATYVPLPGSGAATGAVPTKQADGSIAYAVPAGGGGGGAVASVAGKTGVVSLVKDDVGLPNVTNTADPDKPVSTLQAAAIQAAAVTDGGGGRRKIPATVNWFERATAASQWVASNCAISDDTTTSALGSQSLRLTTSTPSVSAQITKSTYSLDTTGQDIIVMVKFDSLGNQSGSTVIGTLLGDVQLLVSNNTGFTNYYSLHTWFAGTSIKPALPGVWTPLRFSFTGQSLQSTTGTPTRTGITTMRLRFVTSANVSASTPLGLNVGGIGLVPTSKTYPNGVITFTFDDGFASHYSQAKAYLDKYGYAATEYVIQDRVGQSGWLTLSQLRDMQDVSGWDIAPHANTLADHGTGFPALLAAGQLDADLNALSTWMRANGFRSNNSIAYPKGLYNAGVVEAVRNRFNAAVTTSDQPTWNLPDRPDPYLITRKDFSASSGGSQLPGAQSMVDSVRASGGWGIFMIHDIGGTGFTTAADFQALVDYVAASGVAVRTMADVLERAPQITTTASSGPTFTVLTYSGSAYPARPSTSVSPAGYVRYIGPTQPTDWLTGDEWVNNS